MRFNASTVKSSVPEFSESGQAWFMTGLWSYTACAQYRFGCGECMRPKIIEKDLASVRVQPNLVDH